MPLFRLKDTAGGQHSSNDYAGKILVLAWWSFKCPVSLANDERLKAIQQRYRGENVVVLGIASNANESPAEISRNAANLKLSFPILLDSDGSLADRVGATHTPSIYVYDRTGSLRYKGAFDNGKKREDSGYVSYGERALDELLAGKQVSTGEVRPSGCTIKRR